MSSSRDRRGEEEKVAPVTDSTQSHTKSDVELEAIVAFFRRLPFFTTNGTPDAILRQLACVSLEYTTTRDEVILQQGAPCDDGIFFVRSGEFKVIKELPVFQTRTRARKKFHLPQLTQAGQQIEHQHQHQQQQQQVSTSLKSSPSNLASSSSLASIQSTTTFITNEVHRRRKHSLADRMDDSSRRLNESTSMASIQEHQQELTPPPPPQQQQRMAGFQSHTNGQHPLHHAASTDSLSGYRDLSTYDDPSHVASSTSLHTSSPLSFSPSSSAPVIVGSRFLELTVLGPYSTFGEVGVMLPTTRTASVISMQTGSKIVAITKFDFLRLNTKRMLKAVKRISLSYRTNEQLLYELDDTQQWEEYKRHLTRISADKQNTGHKLKQMPVVRSTRQYGR